MNSNRYHRHFQLPGFTQHTQEKLSSASVLVVGAGGLGSPVLFYLAAAGVGTIGIVDDDTVDLSNLQRQILHSEKDIGKRKVDSAAEKLSGINSECQLKLFPFRLTEENAEKICSSFSILVDGTDNFRTRYLLNEIAISQNKPLVFAAVSRFEWQVSVFYPSREGPCYRCLFPEPPDNGLYQNCADAGVLGVLPGLAGMYQATETLKLLTGLGKPLIGQLLTGNSLSNEQTAFSIEKNPDCLSCGPIKKLIVFPDNLCGSDFMEKNLTPHQFEARSARAFILDVRTQEEWQNGFIPGAKLIPLSDLSDHLSEIPKNLPLLIYCRSGQRSRSALQILETNGFTNCAHLSGGILGWLAEGREILQP